MQLPRLETVTVLRLQEGAEAFRICRERGLYAHVSRSKMFLVPRGYRDDCERSRGLSVLIVEATWRHVPRQAHGPDAIGAITRF